MKKAQKMAKRSTKQKGKRNSSRPNLSPLTLLRPRLDGLINNPDWNKRSETEVMADLNAVVRGINAEEYLPVLVRAVQDAPPSAQELLNQLVPKWIATNYNTQMLLTLLEEETIPHEDVYLVKAWLIEMGMDQERLNQERESTFCDAYHGIDDFPSQAFLIIFWYVNRSRSRVRGLNFLIDFNPPWEGAIKDGFLLPQRTHREAIKDFVDMWREKPLTITRLDGADAKAHFLEALSHNHEENIRLHRDITNEKDLIIKHILSLPDKGDAPQMSMAEFTALCNQGKRAEQLMFGEQNFGRRVRMEDGKEIVVLGDPWEDEDF